MFAWEASHQALHNDVMELLVETHCQTRDVFNLMFRKGWYQAESEQKQKLQQTWQQYSSYQNQFPYNPGFVQ